MDNEETAMWIGWIHKEMQALLEDLNEEMRMQEDEDDPFTKGIIYATDSHHTNEISPKNLLEEKLASPLSCRKTNQPLPQQTKNRRGEIPPENRGIRDARGKPPAHNMRTTNTRRQITYDNVQWEGNDTSYLQLPNTRQQTGLEHLSMNDTSDIRLCHRCGGEGNIRKYCNINVHCNFCKSYSHHTSVCRSYANFVRVHPMASSRRTSLAHTNRQTEWAQPMMEMARIDNMRHQKDDETIGKSEPTRRRDISEITRRHLEKVISTMIPLSTCSASDLTENVHMNSLITQPTQQDKQVIVNNYYIKDKGEGWKQVKAGEISPENSESFIQSKPSEISPNDTTMEITINRKGQESQGHPQKRG